MCSPKVTCGPCLQCESLEKAQKGSAKRAAAAACGSPEGRIHHHHLYNNLQDYNNLGDYTHLQDMVNIASWTLHANYRVAYKEEAELFGMTVSIVAAS